MIINIESFKGRRFIGSMVDSINQNLKGELTPEIAREDFVVYNPPFGKMVSSSLNSGLTIALAELIPPYPPFIFEFNTDESDIPYKIGLCFRGSYFLEYKSEDFKDVIEEGKNLIITPRSNSSLVIGGTKPVNFLYIFISPGFLDDYFNIDKRQLQITIGETANTDFLYKKGINTPQINLILSELFRYDFNSGFSKLYLESKSLELLTLFFQQYVTSDNSFTITEKDNILKVHQYILDHLSESLTIKEFIHLSGLNEHKLQSGFKTLFGTTILKHIKKLRLQEARRLILTENYSISEAGFKVGYSNMSHFASAFKQEYGILPRDLR